MLAMRDDPHFDLRVWAGGMHLDSRFGRTIDRVRGDGYRSVDEMAYNISGDSVGEFATALTATCGLIRTSRPDAMMLLGDRTETLAAATAATLEGVPVVHLHGGEETEGAIDNALRHAITKLSQLHLVSHELHAKRVRQLGEPAENVVVVGAAGLDNLYRDDLPNRAALEAHLKIPLPEPLVVVTVQPTTLGSHPVVEVSAVATAMEAVSATYIVTLPNSDAGGDRIREFWLRWGVNRPRVLVVDALGEKNFWGVLKLASAVLGNSSSGILEAPAAGLPVVNVGDRQKGRLRPAHVIDVPLDSRAIEAALRRSLEPAVKQRLASEPALYPKGPAAPRIVNAIARWQIPSPPRKRFADLP